MSEPPAAPARRKPRAAFTVRFYRPEDRAALREICADTGFLGQPIDPVFEDRDLFADYLTGYYLDLEPESTVVLEVEGKISGYVMASTQPGLHAAYEKLKLPVLAAKGLWRYFTRPYNQATRDYIRWILTRGGKETPAAPEGMAHFHFNVRPEARKVAHTRSMVDLLFGELARRGVPAIYAQMVAYEKRRGDRMFERYGFRRISECEVTKYRQFTDQRIYLFTIVKDLTANAVLYGLDLHDRDKAGEHRG
ncbi:MAG: GNAT family acetyltransferase [Verrucomicrobiota bacterium]